MGLAFGGASANRRPRHQIGDELRHGGIQKFSGRRHPHLGQFQQQRAGQAQAVVHVVRAIEMRIRNQPLPTGGGARLFKVDAHDDL